MGCSQMMMRMLRWMLIGYMTWPVQHPALLLRASAVLCLTSAAGCHLSWSAALYKPAHRTTMGLPLGNLKLL
jgi:hypothetical protein